MTGTEGQPPARDPVDEPLTLDLLADLHAGMFDEQVTAELRRRVAADSRASTMLAALDATVAGLAALPQQRTPRMPDDVANRLDAALDAEARRMNRPADPPAQPGWPNDGAVTAVQEALPSSVAELAARRRRRTGWAGLGTLAAAAAAVGVLALSGIQWEITGTPRASDAFSSATGVQPAEPLALTRSNLDDALSQALRARDYGPLSPPQVLRNCLRANDVATGSEPLGALKVTLDGKHGVLLVLPTDRSAQVELLVVGPDCGPRNPSTMAEYVLHR